jgi:hypothetical protein
MIKFAHTLTIAATLFVASCGPSDQDNRQVAREELRNETRLDRAKEYAKIEIKYETVVGLYKGKYVTNRGKVGIAELKIWISYEIDNDPNLIEPLKRPVLSGSLLLYDKETPPERGITITFLTGAFTEVDGNITLVSGNVARLNGVFSPETGKYEAILGVTTSQGGQDTEVQVSRIRKK